FQWKKGALAWRSDGLGGMLAALSGSGGLASIERRGIKYLFYFQVDNPLANVCDPLLLGYHIQAQSEMSTVAISKRYPLERVGNLVRINGRTRIIEYSDLPEEAARQTNSDGSLRIWAGSIGVHIFDAAFLRRAQSSDQALPFHLARKKVAYLDEKGKLIEPSAPNAIKFERFIFDLLPLAERAIVIEADPACAFAPVKNPVGDRL